MPDAGRLSVKLTDVKTIYARRQSIRRFMADRSNDNEANWIIRLRIEAAYCPVAGWLEL